MKKLAYIDSLRGLAVLLVILSHCVQFGTNNYGDLLTLLFSKSEYGVQLFYIASAFTLFLSFRNRINIESSPKLNFFIRRFFRIAPMYYLAILFYLWQKSLWVDNYPEMLNSQIFAQFFFIHGFSPYWMNSIVPGGWSVGLEMLFYMMVPFLFLKIRNLNASLLFFIVSVIIQFVLKSFLIHHPPQINEANWLRYLYCYLPSQLPVFSLGIILFHLLTTEKNTWSIKPIVTLLLFLIITIQFWLEIDLIPEFVFISLGFVFLAYSLSKLPNSFLINPVVNYIGKVSYSMYLIHFAVLQVMINAGITDFTDNNHFTINLFIRLIIVVLITLLVSTVSYYSIEKPMQKAGAKLILKLSSFQNK